jgi:acetamidase/formamidase/alpha-beta hydrolase superfamily lysophospholipase
MVPVPGGDTFLDVGRPRRGGFGMTLRTARTALGLTAAALGPLPFPALVIALLTGLVTGLEAQTVHRLPASPATVAWGHYWSESEPVLRVRSGDIVEVETLLTSSPTRLEGAGVAPEDVEPALRAVYDEVEDRGPGGHILTGPIWVEGARPGDVLEVKVLSIDLPIAYGYNGCSGFLPERCGEPRMRVLPLDRASMTSDVLPGVTVPLRPFFGSMGVAPPPEEGRVSSNPPGRHAGNLDNAELVAGTSLFIPVHVPGALLEVGDGHAAQGDGEVNQTAIETSLKGRLQLVLHRGRALSWPRAETPTHWIAMGTDEDLTVATRVAVEQALELLVDEKGLSQGEAYRLVSIACSVRITELVDGKVGVHVMIPKSIFADERAAPDAAPDAGAPERHTVRADGHPLALWAKRAAAPDAAVLLLHGRTWSALPDFDLHAPGENLSLMDALVARGYATYALDQRGYGATPRDDTGWLTPDRAAEDLAETLRWIRAREPGLPVHLLGWSQGSRVSQLLAQRHPELVDRLVLFGYPPTPLDLPADEPSGDPPRTPNTAEAAASDFITEGSISPTAVEAYVRASLAADPVRVDWTRQHEWSRLDAGAVTVPTLVIHGEHDPIARAEAQAALFQGLGASDKAWVVVPGGDHAVLLERPRGYFIDAVDTFLRGGAGG